MTSVGKNPASPAPERTRNLAASNTSAACGATTSSAEDLKIWLKYTLPSVKLKSMSAQNGAITENRLVKCGSQEGNGGEPSDTNPLT